MTCPSGDRQRGSSFGGLGMRGGAAEAARRGGALQECGCHSLKKKKRKKEKGASAAAAPDVPTSGSGAETLAFSG